MTTTAVATYQEALDAMDGRAYTLDGIHGTIKVSRFNGMTTIRHEPSARGRKTEAYQQVKRKLGDDWSTDFSQSERFGKIAHGLGIRFA